MTYDDFLDVWRRICRIACYLLSVERNTFGTTHGRWWG